MAAGPEGLLKSLGKTRAGPWPETTSQAEGYARCPGCRPEGAPLGWVRPGKSRESGGGGSGQRPERRRSQGAGLTPDLLPSAVPVEGPSYAETLGCPRPLPGNLSWPPCCLQLP